MQFLPTIILRHRKENLKKCSLKGLEERDDMDFYTYPKHQLPSLNMYVLLSMDGPVLSEEDDASGLFLIDGTWKYAHTMYNQLPEKEKIKKRSLPKEITTAYPRKQTDCIDPKRGLASVEALFAAYLLLKRNPEGILDNYFWKEEFLNQDAIKKLLLT